MENKEIIINTPIEEFNPYDPSPFITRKNEKTGEDIILPITENIIRAMEILPTTAGKFRMNMWTNRKETIFKSDKWRIVEDFDYLMVRKELVMSFPYMAIQGAKKADIEDGILYLCALNPYDPVLEYLKDLEWDGIPRIEEIYNALGAEKTPTTQLFLKSWILGMVKRLLEPGSKYDYVIVLEGEQGIGKSFFFHTLSDIFKLKDDNLNHLETMISPDNKDFYMQMMGKIIIEFTEGEIFSKASQEAIKGVVTKRFDTFRPPFGKEIVDVPRRFVFAMTTNSDEYLRDDSGGRRWLPIACGEKIDIKWVEENRDQIFAEAYHRLTVLKEKLPNVETEEARELQSSRKANYMQEESIINWYLGLKEMDRIEGVSTQDGFNLAVAPNNAYEKFDKRTEMIIGNIYKSMLKLERKSINRKGKRGYRYFPTKKTYEIIDKVVDEDIIQQDNLF